MIRTLTNVKDQGNIAALFSMSGSGNGGGYNGLIYVAVDPNKECFSEELQELTNITSIVDILPSGQYVQYDGCDRINPININSADIHTLGVEVPRFVSVLSTQESYERNNWANCISKPPPKIPISAICKFKPSVGVFSASDGKACHPPKRPKRG